MISKTRLGLGVQTYFQTHPNSDTKKDLTIPKDPWCWNIYLLIGIIEKITDTPTFSRHRTFSSGLGTPWLLRLHRADWIFRLPTGPMDIEKIEIVLKNAMLQIDFAKPWIIMVNSG